MNLREQLEQARAEVIRLEREIQSRSCQETGHVWEHFGGRHCGCENRDGCSLPVYRCQKCGDYDYGYNEDAEEIRRECEEEHG